jgi:hypothetical protein
LVSGNGSAIVQKVKSIEEQIATLSEHEYAELREWFLKRDAAAWDAKFEADVLAGKLDSLGEAARQAHASNKTTKF